MSTLDHIVLFAYLAGLLGLGLACTRARQSKSDFHVAARRLTWIPVGISVMIAVFSAINFIGFSGEVLSHGLYVLFAVPVFVIIILPVTRWVIPFYAGLQAMSAYEFLEARFDRRVRCLASLLFVFWRVAWMAVALYTTCLLLHLITGLSLPLLLALAGAIVTIYTAAGGMRAVLWADVAQFCVLFGALAAALPAATALSGGLAGIVSVAARDGLLKPFAPFDPAAFSLDPRIRITVWSALIGTFVAFLARYGADQMVVQRYFSARSAQQAARGFVLNAICWIVALLGLSFLGLAAYAYAVASGQTVTADANPAKYLARFIAAFPPGVGGLFVAGLLAATLSSIDSGLHACCTALAIDFGPRLSASELTEQRSALLAERGIIVVLGALTVALAFQVGRLGSVFEIANRVINGFGSPVLAVCLAGVWSRRFTSRGVLVGGLLGAAWSVGISFFVQPLALHYYAVVNLLGALALCRLCSLADRWGCRRHYMRTPTDQN